VTLRFVRFRDPSGIENHMMDAMAAPPLIAWIAILLAGGGACAGLVLGVLAIAKKPRYPWDNE
jgi:hypothetical protein